MRSLPFYHVKFNRHSGKWNVLRRTNGDTDLDEVVATYMTRAGAREEAKAFNAAPVDQPDELRQADATPITSD